MTFSHLEAGTAENEWRRAGVQGLPVLRLETPPHGHVVVLLTHPDDEALGCPALLARLKRYVIFDQVELEDLTDTLRTVHVWNPDDLPGWNGAGEGAQTLNLAGATVLAGRVNRTGNPGVDLHYLARHEDAVLAALAGAEVPLADLDAARSTP